eukprot:CAMPEP_0194281790 /NCGR_PEP_ID=MMETSP0169-20130528/21583_1 /TAXON_ID=218684 /ORGANISM="Corethron pennatum, Strain L29A3" /LENGTH=32 /DNA_ID= /DNA_START= /DNA_END= /DNA_ORIENTATION=
MPHEVFFPVCAAAVVAALISPAACSFYSARPS